MQSAGGAVGGIISHSTHGKHAVEEDGVNAGCDEEEARRRRGDVGGVWHRCRTVEPHWC